MSILYTNLSDYLTRRAREMGHSLTSLSKRLGFGTSYISGVARGQFTPSQERCWKIAEFFGDDPNIILGLAGYYKPAPDTAITTALANAADDLPDRLKRILLGYATFLKTQTPSPSIMEDRAPYIDNLYIELHGESLEIALPRNVSISLDEISDIILAALSETSED